MRKRFLVIVLVIREYSALALALTLSDPEKDTHLIRLNGFHFLIFLFVVGFEVALWNNPKDWAVFSSGRSIGTSWARDFKLHKINCFRLLHSCADISVPFAAFHSIPLKARTCHKLTTDQLRRQSRPWLLLVLPLDRSITAHPTSHHFVVLVPYRFLINISQMRVGIAILEDGALDLQLCLQGGSERLYITMILNMRQIFSGTDLLPPTVKPWCTHRWTLEDPWCSMSLDKCRPTGLGLPSGYQWCSEYL